MKLKQSVPARIVYVVMGSTGEYSDRDEWTVVALDDYERANQYREKCQQIADAREREYDAGASRSDMKSHLDPNFHMDYTGTRYWISNVPYAHNPDDAEVAAHIPRPERRIVLGGEEIRG